MFEDLWKRRSGRVTALARIVLAAAFLFAIWIDPRQPVQATDESYALLVAYVVASVGVAVAIWNDWWLDAKLAGPMHLVDIGLFTLLVLASDGYTSPFFVFFVFLVLSAAIRWGWRQTAVTAIAVTAIYLAMGLFTSSPADPQFDLQRFLIRTANLVILSALLIWFGITHGLSLAPISDEQLGTPEPNEEPLRTTLLSAAALTNASAGLLVWRQAGALHRRAVAFVGGEAVEADPAALRTGIPADPFLFDCANDRALRRSPNRRMLFSSARSLIDGRIPEQLEIDQGLAVPIRTDTGTGLLVLGGIPGLSIDHVDYAHSLAPALARHIQGHALLAFVKESATGRARLSLARDLHDSIVQFLAGATFRIEAISRSIKAGDRPVEELDELKLLLLHEQQELRSAIGALRSDRIALPTLSKDLSALCERLAKQWDIRCLFTADVPDQMAPMRLHLDTHQLVREAVANAVRHASAKSVTVALNAEDSDLRIDISNDGHGHDGLAKGDPWSLRERVDEAGGTLMLTSQDKGTSISITLPMKGAQQP